MKFAHVHINLPLHSYEKIGINKEDKRVFVQRIAAP